MGRKFKDSSGADLPVGSHEPCKLLSISRHEPSAEVLTKWPDMKPSLCFRFMLHKPDDPELHGATAVRFVTDSVSKLGKLFEFVCDLRDGDAPDEFDEDDYVDNWYRVVVRKKPNSDRLFVSTAAPIDEPDDADDFSSDPDDIEHVRKRAKKRRKKQKKARDKAAMAEIEQAANGDGNDDDDEIPF